MTHTGEITIVSVMRAAHQRAHFDAARNGFENLGVKVTHSMNPQTKAVACWGWRTGKQLRDAGHEVLVFERGYIGDRFNLTSIGWNGLNGHAEFPDYDNDGGERFKLHGGVMQSWRHGGQYALIMGQVPTDASLCGQDLMPWYRECAQIIQDVYRIPVKFRTHPDLTRRGVYQQIRGVEVSRGKTLAEDLKDAAFSLCWNSNASVDSVLAGVPCVVGDRGSMAYSVCSNSLDAVVCPDRDLWATQLAWKQWSLDEIETGKALEKIACRLGQL